jgi:hypothetical protein
MINIDYSEGIRITTGNLKGIFTEDQLPLKVEIKKVISKDVVWETNLDSFMWASFPENEINDVVIKDAKNKFITQYYWDIMVHGSVFYKGLWFYCKSIINKGKKPKGLVVGTHDGEFGEWVPLVRSNLSNMVLVEGSIEQYNKLVRNYSNRDGIELVYEIITPDGNPVEFFEGGKGYTNTVVERVIRYWEKEEIKSTQRNSLAINDLIESKFNGDLDWIHFDVEGLDGKLIMKIKPEYLPNFIIFEDFNLPTEEKTKVFSYLNSLGYDIHSEAGISMVQK